MVGSPLLPFLPYSIIYKEDTTTVHPLYYGLHNGSTTADTTHPRLLLQDLCKGALGLTTQSILPEAYRNSSRLATRFIAHDYHFIKPYRDKMQV